MIQRFLKKCGSVLRRNFSTGKVNRLAGISYLHRTDNDPLKYITFGQCLKNIADRYPDRQAIVSSAENSSVTFSEVLDRVMDC